MTSMAAGGTWSEMSARGTYMTPTRRTTLVGILARLRTLVSAVIGSVIAASRRWMKQSPA
jgi:hypothetical protein